MGFHLPVNRNPAVPIVPIQPFEIFSLFALVSGGLWLPVLTMVEEQWEAFAMSRLWIPGVGRRRVCNKLVGGSLEEVATAHSLCNDTLS